jgi:hypothetical protein
VSIFCSAVCRQQVVCQVEARHSLTEIKVKWVFLISLTLPMIFASDLESTLVRIFCLSDLLYNMSSIGLWDISLLVFILSRIFILIWPCILKVNQFSFVRNKCLICSQKLKLYQQLPLCHGGAIYLWSTLFWCCLLLICLIRLMIRTT